MRPTVSDVIPDGTERWKLMSSLKPGEGLKVVSNAKIIVFRRKGQTVYKEEITKPKKKRRRKRR